MVVMVTRIGAIHDSFIYGSMSCRGIVGVLLSYVFPAGNWPL